MSRLIQFTRLTTQFLPRVNSTIYAPNVYLQALRIQRNQIPLQQLQQQLQQQPIIHYCEQSIAVLECLSKKKKRARKKQIRRKGNKIINARNR